VSGSSDATSLPSTSATPPGGATLDLRTRAAIWLGGALLKLLGMTWRGTSHGREVILARAARGERTVYTLWHGEMLPILYYHRIWTGVMISEHRDGEIIARVVRKFGAFAFRGSSSRGGARALLEGVRLIRSGVDVAITPDGPRGPRHSFAPGALLLAYRAGAPIATITVHVDRTWQLGSWDGFIIPKPFARVTVVYGTPVAVEGSDARDVAAQTDAFVRRMDEGTARAAALARGEPLSVGA
jgi:lysophospholipid acyltransferase (LPLAT)-like uncharacterized protein